MLVLTLVFIGVMAGLFIWLLTQCLRMGAVGGGSWPWQQDAHRDKQPIRYWTGIAGLALVAAFFISSLIYFVWILVI